MIKRNIGFRDVKEKSTTGLIFLRFWVLSRDRCIEVFQRPFCMLGDVLDIVVRKQIALCTSAFGGNENFNTCIL